MRCTRWWDTTVSFAVADLDPLGRRARSLAGPAGRSGSAIWPLLIAAVSIVCLVFYLFMQPQENRNYGGMTAGLRRSGSPRCGSAMLPAADHAPKEPGFAGRAGALGGLRPLGSLPDVEPWTHPWLYNFMHDLVDRSVNAGKLLLSTIRFRELPRLVV